MRHWSITDFFEPCIFRLRKHTAFMCRIFSWEAKDSASMRSTRKTWQTEQLLQHPPRQRLLCNRWNMVKQCETGVWKLLCLDSSWRIAQWTYKQTHEAELHSLFDPSDTVPSPISQIAKFQCWKRLTKTLQRIMSVCKSGPNLNSAKLQDASKGSRASPLVVVASTQMSGLCGTQL